MCPTWRAIDSETFCNLKLDKFSFIVAALLVLLMFTIVFTSWTNPALFMVAALLVLLMFFFPFTEYLLKETKREYTDTTANELNIQQNIHC